MKTVKHQGELLTFQIPDHWVVESEPDGTAVFFDPSDESLTLRLTVLTMQSPRDLGPDDAATVIPRSGLPNIGSPEKLPNGQAVALSEVHHATERDTPIELHSVLVARVIPPRTARLANFTITAVPSVNQAGPMEPRLNAIKTWVRACTISDAPPQAPGGWWKRLFGS
jgi:hypothetical protein